MAHVVCVTPFNNRSVVEYVQVACNVCCSCFKVVLLSLLKIVNVARGIVKRVGVSALSLLIPNYFNMKKINDF